MRRRLPTESNPSATFARACDCKVFRCSQRSLQTSDAALADRSIDLQMAAYDAASNAHARAHTRVNAAVALFDQFGGAFGCTQGSAMMRNEPKCRIW
jgi:hypothetical protein